MEEKYTFPILGKVFSISSSDEAAELVRTAKEASKFVEKAEEDHETFREFMKKYEDVLPDALKAEGPYRSGRYDRLPGNKGIAEKG